ELGRAKFQNALFRHSHIFDRVPPRLRPPNNEAIREAGIHRLGRWIVPGIHQEDERNAAARANFQKLVYEISGENRRVDHEVGGLLDNETVERLVNPHLVQEAATKNLKQSWQ